MSLNKVMLIGRVGADPDVRQLSGDSKVARVSLATSNRYKDRNGDWVEDTTWHTVQIFGKTAEFVENYVGKGANLYVEGRIRNRKFTDQTGAERSVTEIVAEDVQLLDPRRQQEERQPAPQPQQPARSQAPKRQAPAPAPATDNLQDDLPF